MKIYEMFEPEVEANELDACSCMCGVSSGSGSGGNCGHDLTPNMD